MFLATVLGPVVTPVQHPFFDGKPLLLVRADDPEHGEAAPEGVVVAADRVGAGVGERVLVMKEGSSARTLYGRDDAPVRTVIVGIVDEVEVDGRRTFFKGPSGET
ncbi:MAG: EutN/CcmL family microcompartment protein [Planctomycetota bacterium JB042]